MIVRFEIRAPGLAAFESLDRLSEYFRRSRYSPGVAVSAFYLIIFRGSLC